MSFWAGVLITVAFWIEFGWFWGLMGLVALLLDFIGLVALLRGD